MSGKLYVVGTPIGNLGDFSFRAIETLQLVDFIAAEDTRVTVKLLNHFEIKKPMVSYYEHNKVQKSDHIISRLLSGENCALVTDAGMPAISDPGIDLVALCHQHAIDVVSVPGPSAIITAAAISGMDVSRFTFEGFLSMNKSKRREHLREIADEKRTMIFYEAPHKLAATLKDMLVFLGNRNIALIKELTKIHENVELTTLADAAEKYADVKLKGEYVMIIEGKKQESICFSEEDGIALAKRYMAEGLSLSEAAKKAAKETSLKKGDIYKALTEEQA